MGRISLRAPDGVTLDAIADEPVGQSVAKILLVHGITVDLDEGGMFRRLAERLTVCGFLVLRFSFRGHGMSGGKPEGMTIGGEMLDFSTAFSYLDELVPGPIAVVAASFGAVSTTLMLADLPCEPAAVVFWNPVLDLRHTFLEPTLPWGKQRFGPRIAREVATHGFLSLDGGFRLGPVLFAEMKHYDVQAAFLASHLPTLVIHGDRDMCVSYEVAKDASEARGDVDFETLPGSDHGFAGREHGDTAIERTVTWLRAQLVTSP